MSQRSKPKAYMFVKTWQKSSSPDEVAKTLHMNVVSVRQRALNYRKQGIQLKKFPRRGGGAKLDIVALNKLAKEHAPVIPATKTVAAKKTVKPKAKSVKKTSASPKTAATATENNSTPNIIATF